MEWSWRRRPGGVGDTRTVEAWSEATFVGFGEDGLRGGKREGWPWAPGSERAPGAEHTAIHMDGGEQKALDTASAERAMIFKYSC